MSPNKRREESIIKESYSYVMSVQMHLNRLVVVFVGDRFENISDIKISLVRVDNSEYNWCRE